MGGCITMRYHNNYENCQHPDSYWRQIDFSLVRQNLTAIHFTQDWLTMDKFSNFSSARILCYLDTDLEHSQLLTNNYPFEHYEMSYINYPILKALELCKTRSESYKPKMLIIEENTSPPLVWKAMAAGCNVHLINSKLNEVSLYQEYKQSLSFLFSDIPTALNLTTYREPSLQENFNFINASHPYVQQYFDIIISDRAFNSMDPFFYESYIEKLYHFTKIGGKIYILEDSVSNLDNLENCLSVYNQYKQINKNLHWNLRLSKIDKDKYGCYFSLSQKGKNLKVPPIKKEELNDSNKFFNVFSCDDLSQHFSQSRYNFKECYYSQPNEISRYEGNLTNNSAKITVLEINKLPSDFIGDIMSSLKQFIQFYSE